MLFHLRSDKEGVAPAGTVSPLDILALGPDSGANVSTKFRTWRHQPPPADGAPRRNREDRRGARQQLPISTDVRIQVLSRIEGDAFSCRYIFALHDFNRFLSDQNTYVGTVPRRNYHI